MGGEDAPGREGEWVTRTLPAKASSAGTGQFYLRVEPPQTRQRHEAANDA